MSILNIIILFVGSSFLFFGIMCFVSDYMKSEFLRYGLPKQRILTGTLQLLGGAGLIIGFFLNSIELMALASIGLFLLMSAGFLVRLRIKDGAVRSTPALLYALLSLYICYVLVIELY